MPVAPEVVIVERQAIQDLFALLCSSKQNFNDLRIVDAVLELAAALRKVAKWLERGENNAGS